MTAPAPREGPRHGWGSVGGHLLGPVSKGHPGTLSTSLPCLAPWRTLGLLVAQEACAAPLLTSDGREPGPGVAAHSPGSPATPSRGPGTLSQPQFLVRHVEETGHVIPGTAALKTKGRACRGRAPTVASPGDTVKDKGKVTSLQPGGHRERRKHLTAAQRVTGHHREGHGGSEETQRSWRLREGRGGRLRVRSWSQRRGGPRGGAALARE